MKYSEFESVKHLEQQMEGMRLLLKLNKGLRFIGLGSKKISRLENDLKKMEEQLKELTENPQKFNEYFSDRGWITYDLLNTTLMKNAIETFEKSGIDEAEKIIIDHYSPENLKFEMMRVKALPALLTRYKLIEYAMTDYEEGRYYSVVPLLLMVIDGCVNDVLGKGFHSDMAEMDVWDSITNIDNGLDKIREIFRKGRNKTREEEISLPYRNGILHGMDLGYDNLVVATKCWHFLFVVRDWGLAKESEEKRKEKFKDDTKAPSFKELGKSILENERAKKALDDWVAREFTEDYIQQITTTPPTDSNLPETKCLKFLELWQKKNYGFMGQMFWSHYFYKGKINVSEIREQFAELPLKSFSIISISDDAPSVTVFEIKALIDDSEKVFTIRMIYEGKDDTIPIRNLFNGEWKIVFVQEKK